MNPKRLEWFIEGLWLAPVDPPVGYLETEQSWEHASWVGTTAIEFDHLDLGRIKVVPRHYPCRINVGTLEGYWPHS